jgi:allene oxide cyclase
MKRLLVPAAAAAAAVLVFAVVNATAGGSRAKAGGGSIHVIEHATTDAVTNGTAGDSAGNILTFANDVYDAADAHKVGSDQGYCVRTVVGAAWECNWTTFLPGGQITVEGPFSDTGDTVSTRVEDPDKRRDDRAERSGKPASCANDYDGSPQLNRLRRRSPCRQMQAPASPSRTRRKSP